MITRLYANNFRSLVNFEVKFDQLNLLLGSNGAGKSSILDVLHRLVEYVTEGGQVEHIFPLATFTAGNHHAASVQRFELDMSVRDQEFRYVLEVEHKPEKQLARMQTELLECDGKPLFCFAVKQGSGEAQLYHDNFNEGPMYPFDWSRSGVGSLPKREDNRLLTGFKERLARVTVVRPAPQVMEAESKSERKRPDPLLKDFASWMRFLLQQHQGQVFDLTATLRQVVPRFDSFSLQEAGEAKVLYIRMLNTNGRPEDFRFNDLSDGERMLIALYSLLSCAPDEPFTLAVDEPENFVALPEIQPWLDALRDHLAENEYCQALLVSHHPRLINFLADGSGIWISRKGDNGPTVAEPIRREPGAGELSIAQLVEREWIYDA